MRRIPQLLFAIVQHLVRGGGGAAGPEYGSTADTRGGGKGSSGQASTGVSSGGQTAQKIKGRIEVEISIDPAGAVDNVKVLTGNPALTGTVANTLKRWRFEPILSDDGKPVQAVAVLELQFQALELGLRSVLR